MQCWEQRSVVGSCASGIRRDASVTFPAPWLARFVGVPEISRFFGIVIAMYYDDHAHFHVWYGDYRGHGLVRGLPHRVLGMVVEWAASHRTELEENWVHARARAPLARIRPLE